MLAVPRRPGQLQATGNGQWRGQECSGASERPRLAGREPGKDNGSHRACANQAPAERRQGSQRQDVSQGRHGQRSQQQGRGTRHRAEDRPGQTAFRTARIQGLGQLRGDHRGKSDRLRQRQTACPSIRA